LQILQIRLFRCRAVFVVRSKDTPLRMRVLWQLGFFFQRLPSRQFLRILAPSRNRLPARLSEQYWFWFAKARSLAGGQSAQIRDVRCTSFA